eukprot:8435161-Pyramimonas_sp.AAC.3
MGPAIMSRGFAVGICPSPSRGWLPLGEYALESERIAPLGGVAPRGPAVNSRPRRGFHAGPVTPSRPPPDRHPLSTAPR